jgi:glycerophosphoryl diester phosphodiesterase
MITTLHATRLNFARSWRRSVLYGVSYSILSGMLLAPFFAWLQLRALALGGSTVATNVDIAGVVTSLPGLLALFAWSLGSAVILLLGVGGQVVLSADAVHSAPRSARSAFRASLAASPRLMRPALLLVGLYSLVLVPLLALAIDTLRAAAVGSDENLILQVMPESRVGASFFVVGLALVALLCYWLLVRWTFVLHALLIEGRGLRASMQRSSQLVASARSLVLRHVLGLHAAVLGALALEAGLLRLLTWTCLDWLSAPSSGAFVAMAAFLLVVSAVASVVSTALVGATFSSLSTALFRQLGGEVAPRVELDSSSRALLPRSSRSALLLLGGALFVGVLLIYPQLSETLTKSYAEVAVTAHRGSSAEAPENTMAAMRLAIEQGADFSELDVLQARDGAIVVIHDTNLRRLAGRDGEVRALTGAELGAIDVGAWKGERFEGETIPLLRDVIELVRGKMKLNIELKEHGHERDFPASVVALIHELDFAHECVITSLSMPMLREVRAADRDLRIGAIVTASIGDVHSLDVDFYSVERAGATTHFVRRAHSLGRDVHVWTANTESTMQMMIDRGVDSLITDHPARAVAVRAARDAEDELRATLVRLFDR